MIKFIAELLKLFFPTPKKRVRQRTKKVKTLYKMRLERWFYTEKSTIGLLFLDGADEHECCTLEDPVRDTKIYGETAIPDGKYEVIINYSPKYRKQMPRLKNVPNYKGILIHPGNSPKDTLGCILPGKYKEGRLNWVSSSKVTFNKLFRKLQAAKKQGKKIVLEVVV